MLTYSSTNPEELRRLPETSIFAPQESYLIDFSFDAKTGTKKFQGGAWKRPQPKKKKHHEHSEKLSAFTWRIIPVSKW